jgi:hypothetical protein
VGLNDKSIYAGAAKWIPRFLSFLSGLAVTKYGGNVLFDDLDASFFLTQKGQLT